MDASQPNTETQTLTAQLSEKQVTLGIVGAVIILGLAIVIMQIPYIWNAYGTAGGLVTVALAFAALIGGTIWLTLRGKHE